MRSKRMRRSIVRRVLQFIPVLLGITFLAFLLIYLSPSDPVSVRMSAGGISVSPEIMESMRRSMGLDRPLLVQYGDWLWNILHGNMGKSYITDADVLDQILKALPYTLKMAGASLLLTLCISIPVGILTAAMQNSKFDYVVRVMAFVGNALPNFIIALCLMFIFSYRLGWIPVLATTKPIGLVLPALTLALVMSSRYIRQIRAAMLDELSKGYVVGLRSRGLPETTILYKNALKKYYGNGDYAYRYFPRLSSGRNSYRGNRFHLARSRQSYYGRDQPARLSCGTGGHRMDGICFHGGQSAYRYFLYCF